MAETPQTLKNHVRFFPPFHFFVAPIMLLNVVYNVIRFYRLQTLGSAWGIVLSLGLLTLAFTARLMALTVQDRVIRLEMRLRLRDVLPPDLQMRVPELTRQQLVALRFASDAEMAALMREVLAGNVTTNRAIKERVRDWQGDYLRC